VTFPGDIGEHNPLFFKTLLIINQPGFEHSCQIRVYINWTTVGKWGISISLVVGRALQANCSQSPKILATFDVGM